MTWAETSGGDFVNLRIFSCLQAEKRLAFPEKGDEPEVWVVVAVFDDDADVELAGTWPSEKAAQTWIRDALTGSGEKILGHVAHQ